MTTYLDRYEQSEKEASFDRSARQSLSNASRDRRRAQKRKQRVLAGFLAWRAEQKNKGANQ